MTLIVEARCSGFGEQWLRTFYFYFEMCCVFKGSLPSNNGTSIHYNLIQRWQALRKLKCESICIDMWIDVIYAPILPTPVMSVLGTSTLNTILAEDRPLLPNGSSAVVEYSPGSSTHTSALVVRVFKDLPQCRTWNHRWEYFLLEIQCKLFPLKWFELILSVNEWTPTVDDYRTALVVKITQGWSVFTKQHMLILKLLSIIDD